MTGNKQAIEFFVDEDPVSFRERLVIGIAGTLAFVPGPFYRASVLSVEKTS